MIYLYSAASGLLSALAFPSAGLWPLAFFALAPLFFALRKAASAREAALSGFLWGCVFFGILFSGITELYAFVSFPAYIAWAALCAFQALFATVFSLVFRALRRGNLEWLIAASLWVAMEWLRTLGPFGVSGGIMGYSLARFLPLAQVASFAGVYGISFIVVAFNYAVAESAGNRKFSHLILPAALVILAAVFGFYRLGYSRLDWLSGPRVAVIQPNVPQLLKLDSSRKSVLFDHYIRLTREILPGRPDVVIWPETVVRSYLFYDKPLSARLKDLIAGSGSHFVVGFPHFDDPAVYNSAYSFSPEGRLTGRYDKQKLVPFGEYLPARRILYPVLSRFGARFDLFGEGYDSGRKPKLLPVGKIKLGMAICYESTFPPLMLERARGGADAYIVITNDAWFGSSSLAGQHLEVGIIRAIEAGLPLVQVANTGPSAVIDPLGRVVREAAMGSGAAFVVRVPGKLNPTIYLRCGDVFVYLLMLFLAGYSALSFRRSVK